MAPRLWPVELSATLPDGGLLVLRAMTRRDKSDFFGLRARNKGWLSPWEPTNPDGIPNTLTYGQLLRTQRESARDGRAFAFAVAVDGEFAGQLTISNVERGAFRSCTAGYWVGQEFAGRNLMPTALALAGDYMFGVGRLHRLEVNIRPENLASLAVATKLGLRDEGLRRRYLHIDGAWRDHRSFAITKDELGEDGLQGRLRRNLAERVRHTEATTQFS